MVLYIGCLKYKDSIHQVTNLINHENAVSAHWYEEVVNHKESQCMMVCTSRDGGHVSAQ